MLITGIDHVQLAMPAGEEDVARMFCAGLLGLREVEKPAPLASRGGCWFETPGVIVHLGVMKESLRKVGVAVILDNALVNEGIRFFASDPFGNRIEFIQAGDSLS